MFTHVTPDSNAVDQTAELPTKDTKVSTGSRRIISRNTDDCHVPCNLSGHVTVEDAKASKGSVFVQL